MRYYEWRDFLRRLVVFFGKKNSKYEYLRTKKIKNTNVPNFKTAFFTRVVLNFPLWSFEFISNF